MSVGKGIEDPPKNAQKGGKGEGGRRAESKPGKKTCGEGD